MGSAIYDFLTESLLFDDDLISDEFRSVDEHRLAKSLEEYRQFVMSSLETIQEESKQNESTTKIFSGSQQTSLALLKQAAFYVHQFIIPDPLFPLTHRPGQVSETMVEYLRMSKSTINRPRLASAVIYLKGLTPAVAADYVKIVPISLIFEPPPQIPLQFSENQFADALPKAVLEHFQQNAIVKSLARCDDGWIETPDFVPCRSIAIRFRNHDAEDTRMFLLWRPGKHVWDEETRIAKFEMTLPDEPPDLDEFNSWVSQSINETALNSYSHIATEISLGMSCGASYLCKSPFAFDLLGKDLRMSQDLNTHVATAILNMELPFLDKVDLATLMRVRTNDGEVFENFRLDLESKLRDLRLEKDPESIRKKAENAMHDISEVQLHRIESKIKSLRKSALAEAAVFMAGLAGAVQSGGWSVIGAIMAAAQGFRTYENYQRNVKENPSYFLWKVLQTSKGSEVGRRKDGRGKEIESWVYRFDPQAIKAMYKKTPNG